DEEATYAQPAEDVRRPAPRVRPEPQPQEQRAPRMRPAPAEAAEPAPRAQRPAPQPRAEKRPAPQPSAFRFGRPVELPDTNLLTTPKQRTSHADAQTLQAMSRQLEGVLADYGVQGEVVSARPGPVVTLFEFEPAAGVKSSRVIGLSDDIARSMSATACRV